VARELNKCQKHFGLPEWVFTTLDLPLHFKLLDALVVEQHHPSQGVAYNVEQDKR
jgi:hypothetical protein